MTSQTPISLHALALAALALWGGGAFWVASHPPALSSDDALFFLRGLTRFSILDFSPQFPGYPGFVLMGRILAGWTGAPLTGLAALGAALALALPWIGAAITFRASAGPMRSWATMTAFLLILGMPLGPDLALSLLSDGAGLLFVLLGLALLPMRSAHSRAWIWALVAGIALGWALACRPTNLVMALSVAAGATAAAPRRIWPIGIGGALVLLPVAAALLVLEPLYLVEAQRFIKGHAEVWGNVALSGAGYSSWADTARAQPLIAATLAIETLAIIALPFHGPHESRPIRWALAAGFFGHAVWIFGFQNPESLRHLTPLMGLGALAPALLLGGSQTPTRWPPGTIVALILLQASALAIGTDWNRTAPPPLTRAAKVLRAAPKDATLITNHGVELMRETLPAHRVQDAYYTGSAALSASLATGPIWRLSSRPIPPHTPVFHYPGRFNGERDLWLYLLN